MTRDQAVGGTRAAVDMEMEQLTETLTILELNGVITRLPGKQFRIM